jgi:hypothetical protein
MYVFSGSDTVKPSAQVRVFRSGLGVPQMGKCEKLWTVPAGQDHEDSRRDLEGSDSRHGLPAVRSRYALPGTLQIFLLLEGHRPSG